MCFDKSCSQKEVEFNYSLNLKPASELYSALCHKNVFAIGICIWIGAEVETGLEAEGDQFNLTATRHGMMALWLLLPKNNEPASCISGLVQLQCTGNSIC